MNALSATHSIELPQEILTHIFKHLSAMDLAVTAAVSHCCFQQTRTPATLEVRNITGLARCAKDSAAFYILAQLEAGAISV